MRSIIFSIDKVKIFSLFLGAISFVFGILKFVSPFKDWYLAQIETGGLPLFTYPIGIAGEIITGLTFLVPSLILHNSFKLKRRLLILANISFILMLLAASEVHLIPAVPASVLPLKIKPPFIPLSLAAITFFNLVNTIRKTR